jgi:hypothetical protein
MTTNRPQEPSYALAITLYLIGFALIGIGFPIEGLIGAALAVAGGGSIVLGWRRVIRTGQHR